MFGSKGRITYMLGCVLNQYNCRLHYEIIPIVHLATVQPSTVMVRVCLTNLHNVRSTNVMFCKNTTFANTALYMDTNKNMHFSNGKYVYVEPFFPLCMLIQGRPLYECFAWEAPPYELFSHLKQYSDFCWQGLYTSRPRCPIGLSLGRSVWLLSFFGYLDFWYSRPLQQINMTQSQML